MVGGGRKMPSVAPPIKNSTSPNLAIIGCLYHVTVIISVISTIMCYFVCQVDMAKAKDCTELCSVKMKVEEAKKMVERIKHSYYVHLWVKSQRPWSRQFFFTFQTRRIFFNQWHYTIDYGYIMAVQWFWQMQLSAKSMRDVCAIAFITYCKLFTVV